jgi:hypothetical protein
MLEKRKHDETKPNQVSRVFTRCQPVPSFLTQFFLVPVLPEGIKFGWPKTHLILNLSACSFKRRWRSSPGKTSEINITGTLPLTRKLKPNLKASPSLFTYAKSAVNSSTIHEYLFLKTGLNFTIKGFLQCSKLSVNAIIQVRLLNRL